MADLLDSSGLDLVGQVIASDRMRSGRGEEALKEYDNKTSHNVISEYDNKTIKPEISEERQKVIKQQKKPSPQERQREPKAVGKNTLEKRIDDARKMANSPTTTVTLRIPQEMNDWLDTYVHGAWPEKIKKQELVVEGLRLLIARRGSPKTEIIATELLPEE